MKEVSKMIITLINKKVNIISNKLVWINEELLTKLVKNNLFSYLYNEYKIIFNNHVYVLKCPIINSSTKQKIILTPSIIIPGKKYPAHVYLYAVIRYLTSYKMSMRKVAAEVKRKFGLETFSHSTLSRTLKKLKENIDLINPYSTKPENKKINPNINSCKDLTLETVDMLISTLYPILNSPESYSSELIYNFFCDSGGQYFF